MIFGGFSGFGGRQKDRITNQRYLTLPEGVPEVVLTAGLTLGGVVRSAIDTVLTLRGVKRGSKAPLLQV